MADNYDIDTEEDFHKAIVQLEQIEKESKEQ